jgi:hypothetical protein
VDIARTQRTAFQIAELVEDEQRMIAGAIVMAVPDAVLLLAMGRADARMHVDHDATGRPAGMHKVDPLAGQVSKSRINACLPFLPVGASARTPLAIADSPNASSSSR